MDIDTLKKFSPEIPLLIAKFASPKFRLFLETLGFTNIRETEFGTRLELGNDVSATIFGTPQYINDSRLFWWSMMACECSMKPIASWPTKTSSASRKMGIDIGFYMFSGANFRYPMLYDYPGRRDARSGAAATAFLKLRSLVQRVEAHPRPRIAVPRCRTLHRARPQLALELNSPDRGVFIDPEIAVHELRSANLSSQPIYMAATDCWDSKLGFQLPGARSFSADTRRIHKGSFRAVGAADRGGTRG